MGALILRNLERKPVQTAFSTLGIALAVAILLVGQYFEDALARLVEVQFHNVQREDVSLIFHEARPARAHYDVASLPGVLRAEPFRSVAVRLRLAHRTYRSALMGLDPAGELRRLVEWYTMRRALRCLNVAASSPVCASWVLHGRKSPLFSLVSKLC